MRETDDLAVSVLRGHRLLAYDDPEAGPLQATDRLIAIVRARPAQDGRQRAPQAARQPRE